HVDFFLCVVLGFTVEAVLGKGQHRDFWEAGMQRSTVATTRSEYIQVQKLRGSAHVFGKRHRVLLCCLDGIVDGGSEFTHSVLEVLNGLVHIQHGGNVSPCCITG